MAELMRLRQRRRPVRRSDRRVRSARSDGHAPGSSAADRDLDACASCGASTSPGICAACRARPRPTHGKESRGVPSHRASILLVGAFVASPHALAARQRSQLVAVFSTRALHAAISAEAACSAGCAARYCSCRLAFSCSISRSAASSCALC